MHCNLKNCFELGEMYLTPWFYGRLGSLLWATTCSLWSGIKSSPGAGCLQRLVRRRWQWPTTSLPYVHYRRHGPLQHILYWHIYIYMYIYKSEEMEKTIGVPLTHSTRRRMADILPTTFSNDFSCFMIIVLFSSNSEMCAQVFNK